MASSAVTATVTEQEEYLDMLLGDTDMYATGCDDPALSTPVGFCTELTTISPTAKTKHWQQKVPYRDSEKWAFANANTMPYYTTMDKAAAAQQKKEDFHKIESEINENLERFFRYIHVYMRYILTNHNLHYFKYVYTEYVLPYLNNSMVRTMLMSENDYLNPKENSLISIITAIVSLNDRDKTNESYLKLAIDTACKLSCVINPKIVADAVKIIDTDQHYIKTNLLKMLKQHQLNSLKYPVAKKLLAFLSTLKNINRNYQAQQKIKAKPAIYPLMNGLDILTSMNEGDSWDKPKS